MQLAINRRSLNRHIVRTIEPDLFFEYCPFEKGQYSGLGAPARVEYNQQKAGARLGDTPGSGQSTSTSLR
jgi:hypothetical protein